jgi:hypothetical protein
MSTSLVHDEIINTIKTKNNNLLNNFPTELSVCVCVCVLHLNNLIGKITSIDTNITQ